MKMNKRNISKEQEKEIKFLRKELNVLLKKHGYDIFSYSVRRILEREANEQKIKKEMKEMRKKLRALRQKIK